MITKCTPFNLDDSSESDYLLWREWKLSQYPTQASELIVDINDPYNLTADEKSALQSLFVRANMAIYTINIKTDLADKKIVENLGKSFGLERLDDNLNSDSDNITSLQVIEGGRKQGYIPYSNLKLSWHTDGYYNQPDKQVRGIILHCVQSASEGGENALLDHEMLYIHLRDKNPAYISALMQQDVLTIPANIENGVEIRPAQTGPVFSVDPVSGVLHMRYSARKRNITWRDDEITAAAVKEIDDFLASDTPWILRYRLQPGQGLICNNVLHNRTGFVDSEDKAQQRLIYRGRYYDRVANTTFNDISSQMS